MKKHVLPPPHRRVFAATPPWYTTLSPAAVIFAQNAEELDPLSIG